MRVVTWNVNSVRMRHARLLAMLRRHEPDVVCLQETKCSDDTFPRLELAAEGYDAATFGAGGRNGVAILSRIGVEDVRRSFPADPVPDAGRVVSARCGGVRVVCVYAINGKRAGAPEWTVKLEWLSALAVWAESLRHEGPEVVVAGDFNVAPAELDVHDPVLWRGHNLFTDEERARVAAMLANGYADVTRRRHEGPGPFTWWDYREGAFHRGWGLRIDLVLATEPLAARCTGVAVDRDERKPTFGEGKPSDHAPVVADFA